VSLASQVLGLSSDGAEFKPCIAHAVRMTPVLSWGGHASFDNCFSSRVPDIFRCLVECSHAGGTRFAAARKVIARRWAIIGPAEDLKNHVCAMTAGIKSDVAMSPHALF
jgi:hypothetical protein